MEEKTVGRGEAGDSAYPDMMQGQSDHIPAIRQALKDNTDGTVTIAFEVTAGDLPKALLTSPEGSVWLLDVEHNGERFELLANRQAFRDMKGGQVEIRFAAMATAASAGNLYGRRGDGVMLGMALMAGRNPHPYLIDKTERAAVRQRAVLICTEPTFERWIARRAEEMGFPPIPETEATSSENRATEYLYRIAGINSRREILTSNAVAERVESMIREYREYLAQQRKQQR